MPWRNEAEATSQRVRRRGKAGPSVVKFQIKQSATVFLELETRGRGPFRLDEKPPPPPPKQRAGRAANAEEQRALDVATRWVSRAGTANDEVVCWP